MEVFSILIIMLCSWFLGILLGIRIGIRYKEKKIKKMMIAFLLEGSQTSVIITNVLCELLEEN